jgi:NAD-dependent dihydropyrimidine dehydrogenase PreA subunit
MTRIICEPCVGVKSGECVDVCPVDCIHDAGDGNMLYIVPDECIDCGACESVCPVTAIFPEEEVPEQWKGFIPKNYQFAEEKRGL